MRTGGHSMLPIVASSIIRFDILQVMQVSLPWPGDASAFGRPRWPSPGSGMPVETADN